MIVDVESFTRPTRSFSSVGFRCRYSRFGRKSTFPDSQPPPNRVSEPNLSCYLAVELTARTMSSDATTDRSQIRPLPLTHSSVLVAHKTVSPSIHRTPALTSSSLSGSLLGKNTLYFKAENLQKGGVFKFRGASYNLSCLTPEELAKGVCTHSSGMCFLASD